VRACVRACARAGTCLPATVMLDSGQYLQRGKNSPYQSVMLCSNKQRNGAQLGAGHLTTLEYLSFILTGLHFYVWTVVIGGVNVLLQLCGAMRNPQPTL